MSSQERIHQSQGLGLPYDCAKVYTRNGENWNSQFLGHHHHHQQQQQQQPENPMGIHMGIWVQSPNMEQQNFGHGNSPGTILTRIGSPVSAFYAAERYMGFPQLGNPMFSSQKLRNCDPQTPIYQSSGDSSYFEKPEESGFNSLYGSSEKNSKIPCNDFSEKERILQLKRKLLDDFDASERMQPSIPYERHQDISVSNSLYSSQLDHKRQSGCRPSGGGVSVNSGNSAPSGTALSSKTRIRWTQDLHDLFVECINHLGGAEKATPKAILKLMDKEGLTILHVKSHLQKYRIAKYIPESAEGKHEKKTDANDATSMQFREAMQMQLDVQRRLYEQLEIQRNLQLRIEEQGRQLKMMFDQQQKTNTNLLDMQNSTSLDDLQIPIDDGSGNTHFHSKIS